MALPCTIQNIVSTAVCVSCAVRSSWRALRLQIMAVVPYETCMSLVQVHLCPEDETIAALGAVATALASAQAS